MCSIELCDRPVHARTLCYRHYRQEWERGNVTRRCRKRGLTAEQVIELFRTRGAPDECWPWGGHITKGYGVITMARNFYYAHRVVYELHHGVVLPPETEVRHTCHNPPCCNPAHLIPGTHAENMRDMVESGRSKNCGPPRRVNPS